MESTWNIGSRFEDKGQSFRAVSFLKLVQDPETDDFMRGYFRAQGIDPDDLWLAILCTPEEAEFVEGVGISGGIFNLKSVSPKGMVNWSEEHLAMHRAEAAARVGKTVSLGRSFITELRAQLQNN